MKKVRPIFLIGIMLFSLLLPFGSVFAYDGGLLQGETLRHSRSLGNTDYVAVGLASDGDISTGITLEKFNNPSDSKDFLYYIFKDPVNINGLFVNSTGIDTPIVVFRGKDENGHYIDIFNTSVPSSNLKTDLTDVIENVYIVGVYNPSSSRTLIINEFDVFGSSSDIAPIQYDELSNLALIPSHNEVTVNWSIPSDNADFTGSKIYRNGVFLESVDKETNVYFDSEGLNPNTSYTYKVSAVYSDGTETDGVSLATTTKEEPVDESQIPPSNVSDLTVIDITGTSAKLSWVNSLDSDLDSVNIYKTDQSLLTNIPITTEYLLSSLNPETTYNFYVALVDKDGNVGAKTPVTFTTIKEVDSIAPNVPKGLQVEPGSNSLYVSWDKNIDSDLQGYNIYINGIKHNTILVKNTFYAVPNLENDVAYTVSVSAVDTSSNESAQTSVMSGTPISSAMPIIGMDYELKDVAVGIEKWFSSYWLILAFAVSIPLSFYIASRIKLMFFD